jgi:hypothetical protein
MRAIRAWSRLILLYALRWFWEPFTCFDAWRCKVASLVFALAINGFGASKTWRFDSVAKDLMPKSIPTELSGC